MPHHPVLLSRPWRVTTRAGSQDNIENMPDGGAWDGGPSPAPKLRKAGIFSFMKDLVTIPSSAP